MLSMLYSGKVNSGNLFIRIIPKTGNPFLAKSMNSSWKEEKDNKKFGDLHLSLDFELVAKQYSRLQSRLHLSLDNLLAVYFPCIYFEIVNHSISTAND